MTALDWAEAAARWFTPTNRNRWETPGHLAKTLDPATVQTAALDLIDRALVDVMDRPDRKSVV